MKPRLHALALLAVLVGPLVAVARAEISADEVRRAIHEGVTFLLGRAAARWDVAGVPPPAGGRDRPLRPRLAQRRR